MKEKAVLYVLVFFVFALIGALIVHNVVQYTDRQRQDAERRLTVIQNKIRDNAIVTDGERRVITKSWYAEVVLHFSIKKYGCRMTDKQIMSYIDLMYRYTYLFDFPKNYLLSKALLESSFNPYCKGRIGEIGLYQHHSTCMNMVNYAAYRMSIAEPAKHKELDFPVVINHADLRDPALSLKAQVALAWYYKRKYSSPLYWISASHWGDFRIDPWYVARTEPPFEWIFYRREAVVKIDRRHPLLYYYRWRDVCDRLDNRNLDIHNVAKTYRSYIDSCSRVEKEYILARKYVYELLSKSHVIQKEKEETAKKITEYNAMLQDVEKKLGHIYGERKKDKGDFEQMYKRSKEVIRDFLRRIKK